VDGGIEGAFRAGKEWGESEKRVSVEGGFLIKTAAEKP